MSPNAIPDGLKNLLLVPCLIWIAGRGVPPGRVAAGFVFLYACPRIFIDLLREYPLTLWGLPSGQTFNAGMALVGAALLLKSYARPGRERVVPAQAEAAPGWRVAAVVLVLLASLVIPSDATRDIPARYGARHPGLVHSSLYPPLPELR